ncbi:hypothetical protein Vadar_026683 [Vaccinium darrowii]|uniref:Uncharacterized protein n=1 Tax=Vaccinium darrowii TaxID=229202 RepID=A0ACB7Z6C0_9ERIC|nr:hypothetical protein Vadar_026683 [Vaccinium darrowii]
MHSNDRQVEPYLSQQLEENIGRRDEDIGWVREGEGPSIITALREVYKNKKYLPLDMCPKKTKAIRRRLTKRRVINEKPQIIQEYESGKAIPNQQIKSIQVIRPFILRRKKDEVEKFLPGKTQALLGDLSWLLLGDTLMLATAV